MRKKSFAEIVAEVEAMPPDGGDGADPWDGTVRDQSGHVLVSLGRIRPAIAWQLVLDGALLAWDGCGCGQEQPAWVDPEIARRAAETAKPTFGRGNACETYLEHLQDDCGDVVCLRGDVDWGIDNPTE